MKNIIGKAVTLVLVLTGLITAGCKESPTAFQFGPIPHDKPADGLAEQTE